MIDYDSVKRAAQTLADQTHDPYVLLGDGTPLVWTYERMSSYTSNPRRVAQIETVYPRSKKPTTIFRANPFFDRRTWHAGYVGHEPVEP